MSIIALNFIVVLVGAIGSQLSQDVRQLIQGARRYLSDKVGFFFISTTASKYFRSKPPYVELVILTS